MSYSNLRFTGSFGCFFPVAACSLRIKQNEKCPKKPKLLDCKTLLSCFTLEMKLKLTLSHFTIHFILHEMFQIQSAPAKLHI